jgi:hypothetical protein
MCVDALSGNMHSQAPASNCRTYRKRFSHDVELITETGYSFCGYWLASFGVEVTVEDNRAPRRRTS